MKKIIALLLCLIFVLSFAACSSGNTNEDDSTTDTTKKIDMRDLTEKDESGDKTDTAPAGLVPCVIDKEQGDKYSEIVVGQKVEGHEEEEIVTEGTFTTLFDEYSEKERYYVWGYSDKDMKECWQWELCIKKNSSLPKNGSLVTLSGKIEQSDDALDKIWLTDPSMTVKTNYDGKSYDVDLSVMSPTLARVQVSYLFSFNDRFEDKTIAVYGKVVSENLVGHPTNNDSWQMHFETDSKVPKAGKLVLITGVFCDGMIKEATVTAC